MAEKPILFSGEMVRAILDGRKTQTRRVVKPQPAYCCNDYTFAAEVGDVVMYRGRPHRLEESRGRNKSAAGELYPRKYHCPYGIIGDRLWVRETFALSIFDPDTPEPDAKDPNHWDAPRYKADGDSGEWDLQEVGPDGLARTIKKIPPPWRSPCHMPRWASRVILTVTGIRVERVQDISEEDAEAEGVNLYNDECTWCHGMGFVRSSIDITQPECPCAWKDKGAVLNFRRLWDRVNAKRNEGRYAWERNPWVWVVEFRKL